MKKRPSNNFKGIDKNSIVLTLLPKEQYAQMNLELVKLLLSEKDSNGAYVAINKPYGNITATMQKNNIDHSRLFFIDCIGNEMKGVKNCVFLKSPESLTNIGIGLEPIYKSKEHSFIFLDSIDALSLYHKPEMIIKFVRSMINRMRDHGKGGFMISLSEDTDKKIIDELSIVCDKVIRPLG